MSDIIERLRNFARDGYPVITVADEAADEIERLTRALNAAKVAIMNRRVLGNTLIPEYETLMAAAETEIDRALEGKGC